MSKRRLFARLFAPGAAILVASTLSLARTQMPVTQIVGQSLPVPRQPRVAIRIVLHGVHLLPHTDRLDAGSTAVLDYAAALVKQHPSATVYVAEAGSRSGSGATSDMAGPRARLVEIYMAEHGVAPDRLIMAGAPAVTGYASVAAEGNARPQPSRPRS